MPSNLLCIMASCSCIWTKLKARIDPLFDPFFGLQIMGEYKNFLDFWLALKLFANIWWHDAKEFSIAYASVTMCKVFTVFAMFCFSSSLFNGHHPSIQPSHISKEYNFFLFFAEELINLSEIY